MRGRVLKACPLLATDAPFLLLRGRMSRGLEHLQRLGTYLLALLAVERLSRSPALGGFFAPTSQDLESALSPSR